jgi:transposase
MPQLLLPLIPEGASQINQALSVVRENGHWTYFLGAWPIFRHEENDRRTFRMFTAQLVCQGVCKQADVIRTFGVSKNSVLRSVRKFLEEGIDGFYQSRKTRGPSVLTADVLTRAQELLNTGQRPQEVAQQLDLKYDTLRKAIQHGRLHLPSTPQSAELNPPSDKSERTASDAVAEMGTACTRPEERVLAALGMLDGAPTRFEVCHDVTFAGVLCALPALIENGLLRHVDTCLKSLKGYYTTVQVLILLANMALTRIKTVERLQYESPGELGKLLGLDRVPEVRCLRNKLSELSAGDAPQKWAGLLSRDWMEDDPELAGTLYVDGHVRLYHGGQTKLPKRYVSRQRLCLRGTTDYWVNDGVGQPFFVIDRPVDHGLLEALRNDIVPRLLKDVPRQPSAEELQAAPYRSRFVIIFDREGYSPAFFKEMWQKHRIACITYRKYPQEDWPTTEFTPTEVRLANGEVVTLLLAERGSWVGSRSDGLWMREVRKLNPSGHQTSLISTDYGNTSPQDAGRLFSRWSQENFFRYAMEHFGIDLLAEYGTEDIRETKQPVVNPAWRELDRQSRSLKSRLTHRQARFAALTLHPESDPQQVAKWEQQKAELMDEIEPLERQLNDIQRRKKETSQHLEWKDMPEEHKFQQLAPGRKRLLDTVKMIAYRAETAMTRIVREKLAREDDARALLRDLFRSEADILPDLENDVLEVRVHAMANPRSNRAIQHLIAHLNDTAMAYPGTKLRLNFSFAAPPTDTIQVPNQFPADQEI